MLRWKETLKAKTQQITAQVFAQNLRTTQSALLRRCAVAAH
jgi:hypothetical protein